MSVNPAVGGAFATPITPVYGPGPLRTDWGTILPPGGRVVATVSSTGMTAQDYPEDGRNRVTTLAEAVQMVRSGYPDVIRVLPGHTETISDATVFANLKAGTRIIGEGHGSLKPTFTLSATASQFTLDQANVELHNLKFVPSANGVVLGFDITAAGCGIIGCEIRAATGASAKFTTICNISAANARIIGNRIIGTATHNVTDGFVLDTAVDDIIIAHNMIQASATAGNGFIAVDAAVTNLLIAHNLIVNDHTASTVCIGVADVASSGLIAYNAVSTVNNGVAASQGIVFAGTTTTTIKCVENYSIDEPGKSGVLAPAAAAT